MFLILDFSNKKHIFQISEIFFQKMYKYFFQKFEKKIQQNFLKKMLEPKNPDLKNSRIIYENLIFEIAILFW